MIVGGGENKGDCDRNKREEEKNENGRIELRVSVVYTYIEGQVALRTK